ncbi:MAG: cobalamin-dependent protein [Candidatus Brocadiaceae bacterium]
MNILLIDPPFYRFFHYYNRYFPLGLGYLASTLKKAGHRVTIYDADCNRSSKGMDYTRLPEKYRIYLRELQNPENLIVKEISEIFTKYQSDLVGITVMTPKMTSAFTVAALAKRHNKDCNVVFGGPHATLKSDELLKNCKDVDFVVSGEGEATLPDLANALDAKRSGTSKVNFNRINGLSYRQGDTIVHNTTRRFVDNLDELPFPAREILLGMDTYTSEDMGLLAEAGLSL